MFVFTLVHTKIRDYGQIRKNIRDTILVLAFNEYDS